MGASSRMILFPRGAEQGGGIERSWVLGSSHNSQSPGGLSHCSRLTMETSGPGLCNNQA